MNPSPVALVTGASSGIGLATARGLAQQGYHVFGTSRNPEAIVHPPDNVELLPLDITSTASVTQCIQTIVAREQHIDIVINNAGYALMGAVEETTIAEARAIFETDFFGAVRVTQAVLPFMRAQRSGTIIFMSVVLGLIGQPFGAFLSSAKHALEGFAESLYYEVQPFNISVTLIEPAFVATNADRAMRQADNLIEDYNSMRTNAIDRFTGNLHNGIDPSRVALTIEHVLRTPSPPLRYTIGMQARMVPTMKHLLPAALFTPIAQKAYGLAKEQ